MPVLRLRSRALCCRESELNRDTRDYRALSSLSAVTGLRTQTSLSLTALRSSTFDSHHLTGAAWRPARLQTHSNANEKAEDHRLGRHNQPLTRANVQPDKLTRKHGSPIPLVNTRFSFLERSDATVSSLVVRITWCTLVTDLPGARAGGGTICWSISVTVPEHRVMGARAQSCAGGVLGAGLISQAVSLPNKVGRVAWPPSAVPRRRNHSVVALL